MVRFRGVCAVLALALLPVAAAQAAHVDGWLVVTGSRSVATTITLPARSELVFDASSEPGDGWFEEQPVISGGRDLAGLLVTDQAGRTVLYDVLARVGNDQGVPSATLPQPRPERVRMRGSDYYPGEHYFDVKRYTVTLLADAPVTVRIKLRGTSSRTLRPATPVAVAAYRSGLVSVPTQVRGPEARVAFSLRRTSTVLMYGDYATTGYQESVQWLCVGDPGEPCDDRADAWTERTYDYGMLCGGLCGTSVKSTAGKGSSWLLRPRRQGAVEAVARSSMPYGVTTDQRAYVLVVG